MYVCVVLALGAVPLQTQLSPHDLAWYVGGQVGALPSESRTFLVAPYAPGGSVAPNEFSPFRTNTSDIVYVDVAMAVMATAAGTEHLGVGGQCLLSATWGVCDNALHLGVLPRHCRRGVSGTRWCPNLAQCGVSFTNTQHHGTCVNGMANVPFDTLSYNATCDVVIVAGKAVSRVVHSQSSLLSLHAMGASFEYACDASTLTVWEPPPPAGDIGPLFTMVVLVVFLSMWGAWTADIARATATYDTNAIERVWEIMGTPSGLRPHQRRTIWSPNRTASSRRRSMSSSATARH